MPPNSTPTAPAPVSGEYSVWSNQTRSETQVACCYKLVNGISGTVRGGTNTVTGKEDYVVDVVVVDRLVGTIAVGLCEIILSITFLAGGREVCKDAAYQIAVPLILVEGQVNGRPAAALVHARENDLTTDDAPCCATSLGFNQSLVEPVLLTTTHEGTPSVLWQGQLQPHQGTGDSRWQSHECIRRSTHRAW